MEEARANFGRILKQQRVSLPLTLRELSSMSGVSASHLGRIERGERFPSGSVLRRIAEPLGFEEDELFTLAGYLSPQSPSVAESRTEYGRGDLDPYVARVLAQEPVDVQRAVIGILSILRSIAKSTAKESR
jgi:transcriptional regulator with XRE-family HTH domain